MRESAPSEVESMADDDTRPQAQPKVQLNDFSRENPTRAFNECSIAGQSPFNAELFKVTEWELRKVAEKRGLKILELTKLRVANVEGESRVWLYPTKKSDPRGIAVTRNGGKVRVNLGPQLTKWGLALPRHHKEWFYLIYADAPESPVGPALYFDLESPYRIKLTGKKAETPAQRAAAGNENQTPDTEPETEQ